MHVVPSKGAQFQASVLLRFTSWCRISAGTNAGVKLLKLQAESGDRLRSFLLSQTVKVLNECTYLLAPSTLCRLHMRPGASDDGAHTAQAYVKVPTCAIFGRARSVSLHLKKLRAFIADSLWISVV